MKTLLEKAHIYATRMVRTNYIELPQHLKNSYGNGVSKGISSGSCMRVEAYPV
jgi:hypothetical protein